MVICSLLCLAPVALAEVPIAPAPDCEESNPDACFDDLLDHWSLLSWIPEPSRDSVRPAELSLGSGISADIAFREVTGDWDVVVAVLDSGIQWDESSLVHKIRLNTGELPLPQDVNGVEAAGYDLDGNGVVNVSDYIDDPRVDLTDGEDDSDDWFDASDLIAVFSDGVDDDGNGYVDDIAGWDFFTDDNNAYAVPGSTAYHGSSVMRRAAGEAGDGGSIGVCPNCSVLPLRVGDGFITEGDRIAMAVAYAVDNGAKVIGMALGGLSLPQTVRDAFEYAEANDVVLIAASGDENSYHRNLPGVADPVVYVHSIRSDSMDEDGSGVYSFLNFHNCNNYSPRLDVVAPSEVCGTGSVARITGLAGLIHSAGVQAGTPLTAAEVRAVLQQTVDDIDLAPEEVDAAVTYPSQPGWDGYFGYGRVNAAKAVDAVLSGALPPATRITHPQWFSWHTEGTLTVEGAVSDTRSSSVSWVLEAGTGLEPDAWEVMASGDGAVDGVLAEVDLATQPWGNVRFADLDDETVDERYRRAHEPLVTFRLTATDADGVASESRRGVWVHRDIDARPGFPVQLDSSAEASAVLAELDGNDGLEIVLAGSDGSIHVLDGAGAELPGFPVMTHSSPLAADHLGAPVFAAGVLAEEIGDGILATPAVGDVDGDGSPDIVVATLRGRVFAWSADGTELEGFPVDSTGRTVEELIADRAWDTGFIGAPALGDVDGDGALEIIAGGLDQRLYAWAGDGSVLPGFPMDLCDRCDEVGARIVASPALGDVDGDGDLDAVLGTNEIPIGDTGILWAIDLGSAEPLEGFPITRDGLINQSILPVIGEGHPSSVALADLDGDGDLEIASFAMLGTNAPIHHDGTDVVEIGFAADAYGEEANFRDGSFLSMVTNPSFGDMDFDGTPDLILGGASVMWVVSLALAQAMEFDQALGGWSMATGEALPGFPRQADDVAFLAAAAIGDVSGDGLSEAVFGTGGYFLHAWDARGRAAPNWPKFAGGWILGAPALGDVDGDGYRDVVVTTRDGLVHAWSTRSRADIPASWAALHHDAQNTGNHETPLPVQAGPQAVGCCGADNNSSKSAVWLPLLGLGVWMRRRR